MGQRQATLEHLASRPAELGRATVASLAANVVLAAVKVVVGLWGASSALLADGIESLADVFSSLVVWNGMRVGAKAPDAEHPYGHGKAEAIATLLAGLGLLGSGFWIAAHALAELGRPSEVPAGFTVWVLVAIIIVKVLLYGWLGRLAARWDSPGLRAEALHHRSDALTSAAVFIGLAMAVFGGPGWAAADDWAALLVTVLIVFNGVQVMRPAIDELMDRHVEGPRWAAVNLAVRATPGVLAVDKLWVRRSGSRYHVDVHLEVDGDLSVRAGHDIAHEVKGNLKQLTELDIEHVGTHVEPHRPDRLPPGA